jgi:hypothetical protein
MTKSEKEIEYKKGYLKAIEDFANEFDYKAYFIENRNGEAFHSIRSEDYIEILTRLRKIK